MMVEALRTMILFLLKNWTIRDPRSPGRHPWRWCLFVAVDILISKLTILRPKSGVAVILVNRLGDAIVGRPLVMEIQSILKKDDESFLVLGDKSWEVLGDNIYKDIPNFCRHIDPNADIDIQPLRVSSEYKLFSEKIVVLNPGAKNEARMWPLIEWIELACQIAERGYTVCFIGGPAEERLIPEFYDLIKLIS